MALRPIDNDALVLPPERLKEQVKVSVPVQKQSDLGANDENKAPPSADAIIDYISSDDLVAFQDPELKIKGVIEGLDSKDWTKREKLMLALVKAIKNPRSALCKTSIMASSDIFNVFGDKMLDSNDTFDNLLLQLLLKASQDKMFVCEEADRALNAMVKSMTSLPLLRKLCSYVSHANLRVRQDEAMEEFGLVSLVQMASDLLNDRLPEAREAARNIVIFICEAYTRNEEQKQELWQHFCQSNLQPIYAQSAVKITSSR